MSQAKPLPRRMPPTFEQAQQAQAQQRRMAAFDLNSKQRYATDQEISWLQETAATLPPDGLVVMLGAGPGVMLAAVKDGNPTIHAFVVDIDTCDYMIAHLRHYGFDYANNVYSMVGDSYAVGTHYEGRLADLLIVDADHSERGVGGDILAWLPHVKEGGLVFFHDYDATGTWFEHQEQYTGVRAAVEKYMRPYEFVIRAGTSIIYRNTLIPPPEVQDAHLP